MPDTKLWMLAIPILLVAVILFVPRAPTQTQAIANEACDDGQFCTVGDRWVLDSTTNALVCQGAEPIVCTQPDMECFKFACNEQENTCEASYKPKDSSCTRGGTCDGRGACIPGTKICRTDADTDCNELVSKQELLAYLDQFISGSVTQAKMLGVLQAWIDTGGN